MKKFQPFFEEKHTFPTLPTKSPQTPILPKQKNLPNKLRPSSPQHEKRHKTTQHTRRTRVYVDFLQHPIDEDITFKTPPTTLTRVSWFFVGIKTSGNGQLVVWVSAWDSNRGSLKNPNRFHKVIQSESNQTTQ